MIKQRIVSMLELKQTKPPRDLSEALIECKDYAKRGRALADDAVSLLDRVVDTVSKKLQTEIDKLQRGNFSDNVTTDSLVSQLSAIRSNFKILPQRLVEDVDALSRTSFSITLFGRTMAGIYTFFDIFRECFCE